MGDQRLDSSAPSSRLIGQQPETTARDRATRLLNLNSETTDASESTFSKLVREADLLLHGSTSGALDEGLRRLKDDKTMLGLEVTAGIALGAGLTFMQRKAGWVKIGAEVIGLSLAAVAAKDIATSDNMGLTWTTMKQAWNDPMRQDYYKNRMAESLGPLAFDSTIMIAAGSIGAKGARVVSPVEKPGLVSKPAEGTRRTDANTKGPAEAAKAEISPVYQKADLYDVAFSYRDIPKENGIMTTWYKEVTGKSTGPTSVLELASGPGRHAREFAARGVDATVLDNSSQMVAFAKNAAKAEGVPLSSTVADMTNFKLPVKQDMAVTMLDSAGHLHTEEAMVAHLKAVGANLKPGGVYVMEFNNPSAVRPTTQNKWSMTRGDTTVEMQWGKPGDPFNPATGVKTYSVEVNATTPQGKVNFTDSVPMREWDQRALDIAIQKSGMFDRITRYGDFAFNALYDPANSWRMIYVLARNPL